MPGWQREPGLSAGLARQVACVRERGWAVVIVSSGAIACGLSRLGIEKRPCDLPSLQAAASVGQPLFFRSYDEAFAQEGIATSLVLLTRRDTADRTSYLHARDTLRRLIDFQVVPIVNENDTVSVEQIKFGDNDTLGALVACLLGADLCVILSDVEGFYDANPATHPDARLVSRIERIDAKVLAAAGDAGSSKGTGGMVTKLRAARALSVAGIPLVICSGAARPHRGCRAGRQHGYAVFRRPSSPRNHAPQTMDRLGRQLERGGCG